MMISPQAEKLFNEAITLVPDERAAYLKSECAGNVALYNEVSSLLTAANESQAYFDSLSAQVGMPALAHADELATTGKVLGQWRLVRLLGKGGMGSVYLAERVDGQFEKQVALKTLSIGFDNDLARTRFVNERQILARLVHDNIARLLDGGVSDDGTPYFVMDYVAGARIDQYCEDHGCSIEQKVDLIIEVARGVQYAHRNLIIHRDLKPTNILVDERGRPRLLDFGIAKVLEPNAGDEDLTQLAQRPVTPAYASPEMLRGEQVDVTTDVYSLAAVLYQLLTRSLPLSVEGFSLAELHQRVSTVEPVTASKRNVQIDSDLDAVLLKGLAKHATERYASIESFAEDLVNWREGRPITAKTPSAFYRARKFAQRNLAGVALGSVALLSLCGFAVFAAYSAARSEQQSLAIAAERDRVEATKEFLIGIFDGAGPNTKGETLTAVQVLDSGRLRVREELADQPRLQADMVKVIGQVYANLGVNEAWREMLIEQLNLLEALEGKNSQSYFDALVYLAEAQDMLGDYAAAEAAAVELVEISSHLDSAISEGDARIRLGRSFHLKGDFVGADREYKSALSLFQQEFGNDNMRTAKAKLNIATLLGHQQHHQEAYDLLIDVEQTHKRVKTDTAIVETDLYLTLARTLSNLGRYDEALTIYQKTFDLNNKAYGEDNSYNLYIVNGMSGVAEAQGEYDKALELSDQAMRLLRLHTPDSPNIGRAHLNNGRIYQLSDRCGQAVPEFRQAVKILIERLPGHAVVGSAKSRLGYCLAETGQVVEAERLLVEGHAILAANLASDHDAVVGAKRAALEFFEQQGDIEKADAYR